jgi:hypothetical protein
VSTTDVISVAGVTRSFLASAQENVKSEARKQMHTHKKVIRGIDTNKRMNNVSCVCDFQCLESRSCPNFCKAHRSCR